MIGVNGHGEAGTIKVITSPGQHSPETWAAIAGDKIVSVSDTAPRPIRDQANAYKDRVVSVLAHLVRQVIKEDREYLAVEMERQGHPEIAAYLRSKGI